MSDLLRVTFADVISCETTVDNNCSVVDIPIFGH